MSITPKPYNLFSLTPDVFQYTCGMLEPSDILRFTHTCQTLFTMTKLQDVIKNAEAKLQLFLSHIMNSRLVKAKLMLLLDPGLIHERQSIGEHENVNGLELAWQLGDVGMCEMILETVQGKTAVQLPGDMKKKPLFDVSHFEKILAEIVAADKDTLSAEIQRHLDPNYKISKLGLAMDNFRMLCDQHGEMTPQDVDNAMLVSGKSHRKISMEYLQIKLFFYQVIGYTERLTPVWFRQSLAHWVNDLLRGFRNPVLQRAAEYRVCDVVYPLVTLKPNSGLGFDFACDDSGFCKDTFAVHEKSGAFAMFTKFNNKKFAELAKRFQPEVGEPEVKRIKL